MPTIEQGFACIRVCQMLSTGYQPVHVFRYNENTQTIFILAGVTESLEIVISPNGQWRFINEQA
jgi:hypothetical protein